MKKIEDASIEYQTAKAPRCIGGAVFEDMVREINMNKDFIEGAIWMHAHYEEIEKLKTNSL